jgi:hypothetical protein
MPDAKWQKLRIPAKPGHHSGRCRASIPAMPGHWVRRGEMHCH